MSRVRVDDAAYAADALLLDKDGTLVDVAQLWGPWARILADRTAELLDGAVHAEELLRGLGVALDGDAVMCDPAGPLVAGSLPETRAALAATAYAAGVGWPRARDAVDAAEAATDQVFERAAHVRLRVGAATLLDAAARTGVRCALVTSDDRDGAIADLEAAGVRGRISAVVGADDVARGKPAPDAPLAACEALGVAPRRAVMIGDTDNDVRAGRAAGCIAVVGVADAGAPAAHLRDADHVVRDLAAIRVEPGSHGPTGT